MRNLIVLITLVVSMLIGIECQLRSAIAPPPAPEPPAFDYVPGVARVLGRFIAKYEGGPVHNPGNLVYARQAGAVPDARGYAIFPDGRAALRRDLRAKLRRGMTVRQILDVWCEGGCNYAWRVEQETPLQFDVRY